MKKVYVFLANGFEDIEALIPVDVLRRGGVDVTTVSTVDDSQIVESAHGVQIVADKMFDDCDFSDADLLMLPGGMPGSSTCYPGFEQLLKGAHYTAALCTTDGNITTGEGPAAALPFAYELLAQLTDAQTSRQVAVGMRFAHLMEK